jgi:bifunctional DNA-binding transcriptional regulator/antitoxin component of YhaV-PrlF toxin-antitoxin module
MYPGFCKRRTKIKGNHSYSKIKETIIDSSNMIKIVKLTNKGQIILPIEWRQSFDTDYYIIKSKKNKLEIIPLEPKELTAENEDERLVFSTIRDNQGKGIKAKELRSILKNL